jgi:hypothetical protein
MKRMLTLCAIGAIVAGVSVAQAAVTTNDTQTIPFVVFIPCANGGAGEVVSGTIQLHTLITSTVNGNKVSGKTHFQPQGGSLVGETTGDAYRPTGVTQDTFNGSLQNGLFTQTFINNFRIIGQGPGNNFLVHESFHLTINANGVTTVTHDNVSEDCK